MKNLILNAWIWCAVIGFSAMFAVLMALPL
jgi:hypothetical protein